jgi:hypothetical protein
MVVSTDTAIVRTCCHASLRLVESAPAPCTTATIEPGQCGTEGIASLEPADLSHGATESGLIIAHRLSTVIDADQILVREDGCVVEQGRDHQLLARGATTPRCGRATGPPAVTAQWPDVTS